MEQIYIPKQDYKVLVRCFTYNQSKYIEDALNGFAMQQTEFPFVCLVMDDCSTDGEQEVIKAWMGRECDMVKAEYIDIELSNVILVPHKSNTSCTFAFYFLKQNLYGSGKKKMNMVYPWRESCEYEALCEGDDYWIDPFKLKEQNFYLDTHLDCCLIWAKAKCYIQNKNKFSGYIGDKTESLTELLYKNGVSTLTTMFRITALDGYSETIQQNKWLMGDKPLWLYFSINNKIHFENKVYGVYRVLQQSASLRYSYEARKQFIISSNDVCQFFSENLHQKS